MKIGLTLSGGGVRGVAHLGVIKALEEHGFTFSRVSGASAGSIIGAFYCYGYSTDEILEIIEKTSLYKMVRPAISWRGLLKLDKAIDGFKTYLPEDTFESLKKPLHIAVTNISKAETRFFYEGELIKVIQASSSIPVVFDPVEIDGQYYIDGGILNNLPVEPLLGICDKIVGVHCNPIGETSASINMKMLMERSLHLAINQNVAARKHRCHLYIEPEGLEQFGVFDVKKVREIYQIGYDYTKKLIKKDSSILEMLK